MDAPRRRPLGTTSTDHDGYGDPTVEALTQLLQSERRLASVEEPALMKRVDPGLVWLLWFAIGATDETCHFVHRRAEIERNQVFRHVVRLIFGNAVQSPVHPGGSSQELIDLFESAGAAAVRACMRGDRKLGYYVEALRVSVRLLS